MRNVFLILTLFLFSLPNHICLAEETTKERVPIIIGQQQDKPNRPRTPDYGSDIMAYYQDGMIYFQFAYDMGEVEITVTNESTGEMWQQTDDSAFGATSIASSTTAGNYYITIVTDDASCYSGSFTL